MKNTYDANHDIYHVDDDVDNDSDGDCVVGVMMMLI